MLHIASRGKLRDHNLQVSARYESEKSTIKNFLTAAQHNNFELNIQSVIVEV